MPEGRATHPSSRIVQEALVGYAQRGMFQAFGEQAGRNGHHAFSFRWHLDTTLHLDYDPARLTLTVRDLLPHVGTRSAMDRELRRFVRERMSPDRREHRRIDPQKATVTVRNRKGMVSLVVAFQDAHVEYGVRKVVNLVHELFVDFLRYPLYFPYLVEHFNLDPDLE